MTTTGTSAPEGDRSRHDRNLQHQRSPGRGSDQPGVRSRIPLLISSRTRGALMLAEDW